MATEFSRGQRRILTAFIEALLPSGVGLTAAPSAAEVSARVEEFAGRIGAHAVIGLGLLLVAFDWSVVLVWGRFARFVSLDAEDRIRYLRAWDESRLYLRRATLLLLKTVVTMVYGSIPEVQRAIGYRPGNIVDGALREVGS